jgi:peroxin-1
VVSAGHRRLRDLRRRSIRCEESLPVRINAELAFIVLLKCLYFWQKRGMPIKPKTFDDFEALVPRRGGGDGASSGVTDRLVNQLLTMLDGAEGLGEGVFVLAATSRPDMIDPALLRPGRLDRRVFCDLPTEAERLDILCTTIQAQQLALDEGASAYLATLAACTTGYTCADLVAVLNEASLLAIQDHVHGLQLALPGEPSGNSTAVVVTQGKAALHVQGYKGQNLVVEVPFAEQSQALKLASDALALVRDTHDAPSPVTTTDPLCISRLYLEQALSSSRPSLSLSEKRRCDARFEEFLEPGMRTGSTSGGIGTLSKPQAVGTRSLMA